MTDINSEQLRSVVSQKGFLDMDIDVTLDLFSEIEKLKNELNNARTQAPEGTENLAKGDYKITVHYSFNLREGYRRTKYEDSISFSWDELFYVVSPLMINEANDRTLKIALNSFLDKEAVPILYKAKTYKDKDLEDFVISDADYQTIKVQFKALGLINKSSKSRSVKDVGTYWALTPYGDELMTKLRAIKK